MAINDSNSGGQAAKKVQIEFPKNGQDLSVTVEQNSAVDLTGINLEEAKIDILGNDLIISDPATGAQVILVGMVLYLFDEDANLSITINGNSIEAQQLLSKEGVVESYPINCHCTPIKIEQNEHKAISHPRQPHVGSLRPSLATLPAEPWIALRCSRGKAELLSIVQTFNTLSRLARIKLQTCL